MDTVGASAIGDHAADQAGRHIAAAYETNGFAHSRSPKTAVPILTMVEPSAIAASMSPVIPIDSVSQS